MRAVPVSEYLTVDESLQYHRGYDQLESLISDMSL
jgi:hypothetical protein